MPDSVTVLVVPGLSAYETACTELDKHLPECVPLGPSFPVLEQVVLGTLFSGRQGPGLGLWTRRGQPPADPRHAERPLWLWEHLADHLPQSSSACWLLPLPGQRASLGARPAEGDNLGPWNIWPAAVREVVQQACGPWPRPFPADVSPSDKLQFALETLLRWCFVSAAAAFRHSRPALGLLYVPVVLAGAYLWGPDSVQGAALARRCAMEVLEFSASTQAGIGPRGTSTLFVIDPWGLQPVEQRIELEPVRRRLEELARRFAPARQGTPTAFTLQAEHQVARITWPRELPLVAEQLQEELAPLVPQTETATAQQCGIVPPGRASLQEARSELWLLAPEKAAFTCSGRGEETPPEMQLACWELPAWLKRWGIELGPVTDTGLPQATHGLAPREEKQRGRLWTGEPGLLFGQVLSDLDLAALVLAHWGI